MRLRDLKKYWSPDRQKADGEIEEKKRAEDAHEVAQQAQRDALVRLLIDVINFVLGTKILGGNRVKAPGKHQLRAMALEREEVIQGVADLDTAKEVLRVGRRVKMGAEIKSVKLSESVLGALLTMPRVELAHLLQRDHDAVERWTAVQLGHATPDATDRRVAAPAARQDRREPSWPVAVPAFSPAG